MNTKRIVIATLLGVMAGIICWLGGEYGAGITFTGVMIAGTILNRTLIGFVIGISGLRMNYLLHGILIGAVVTLTMAVFGDLSGAIALMLFGMGYGFLIELLTTKVFKAPVV